MANEQLEYFSLRRKKIIFLGNTGVGKTSLISAVCYSQFTPIEKETIPTIAIDFISKTMTDPDGNIICVQIWDTGGQEKYHSLLLNYYRDTSFAIIVYDISDKNSFNYIPYWISHYRSVRGDEAPFIIVGNKLDLVDTLRQVPVSDLVDLASKYNVPYMETTANETFRAKLMMSKVIDIIHSRDKLHKEEDEMRRKVNEKIVDIHSITLSTQPQQKTFGYCQPLSYCN